MSLLTPVVVSGDNKSHVPIASPDTFPGKYVQISADQYNQLQLGSDGGVFVPPVGGTPYYAYYGAPGILRGNTMNPLGYIGIGSNAKIGPTITVSPGVTTATFTVPRGMYDVEIITTFALTPAADSLQGINNCSIELMSFLIDGSGGYLSASSTAMEASQQFSAPGGRVIVNKYSVAKGINMPGVENGYVNALMLYTDGVGSTPAMTMINHVNGLSSAGVPNLSNNGRVVAVWLRKTS